jgi:PAS domain S-box-containing protein
MDMYEAAFEGSPDMVVCVDQGGRIVEVNRKCQGDLGYGKAELMGRPVDMLVPERFRPMHAAHRAGYQADPGVRAMGSGRVLFARRKDGTEIPVDVMLSTAKTAAGAFVIAVLRDITAIREAERRAESMVSSLQLSSEAAGMG